MYIYIYTHNLYIYITYIHIYVCRLDFRAPLAAGRQKCCHKCSKCGHSSGHHEVPCSPEGSQTTLKQSPRKFLTLHGASLTNIFLESSERPVF